MRGILKIRFISILIVPLISYGNPDIGDQPSEVLQESTSAQNTDLIQGNVSQNSEPAVTETTSPEVIESSTVASDKAIKTPADKNLPQAAAAETTDSAAGALNNASSLQRLPVGGGRALLGLPGFVEGGLEYDSLDGGFPFWFGEYLNISKQINEKNTFFGEIHHRQQFGEQGTSFGVNDTYTINNDWYTQIGIAGSDTSIYWQQFSVSAALFRKFLSRQQLVTYLGYQKYWWRTSHITQDINPGIVYYFDGPWAIEMGGFLTRTQPGGVQAPYQYIALTQGKENEHYVVLRYAFGKEAYQAIASGVVIENFPSHVWTLTWRQWLTKNWGFNAIAEAYMNPYYDRYGITFGIFRDL